jgi:hypothetical protein
MDSQEMTMETVIRTHSVSLAESVRLALAGAGVEAIILDPYSAGSVGPVGNIRVAILDDTDLPVAMTILGELRPPTSAPLASWWWHKRALVVLSVALPVFYPGTQIAADAANLMLTLVFLAVSAILFLLFVSLLLFGYRADKGLGGWPRRGREA